MGPPLQPDWAAANEEFQLPVSRDEIDARRDAVLRRMAESEMDVAVFTSPQSIYYLTGIKLGFMYYPLVLGASGAHQFLNRLIDAGWQEVWANLTWAVDWRQFRDEEDIDVITADAVRDVAGRATDLSVGFELERPSISYMSVQRIAKLARVTHVVSATALVEDLRVVKSPAEQELMRRAGQISAQASDAIVEALRSGATDAEAAATANSVVTRAGGMAAPWPPFVMTGASGGTGHLPWARRAPSLGEAVTWYVSGFVHNYGCPIERTIIKGPDTHGIRSLVESVANAVEHLSRELKPGMTSADAYRIALEAHKESGTDVYWRNHAAYAVGILWAEFDLMRLRPDDHRQLLEGMTLHLVPCLTIPGLTNAQASRVIVMTENGTAPLVDYPLLLPDL